jgi:hypothetical protein
MGVPVGQKFLYPSERRKGTMQLRTTLGTLAVAAAASTSLAAINLSAPELFPNDQYSKETHKQVRFFSDKNGYAVVYIIAQNVPGYNAGEIVQTLRGNMVNGLNAFNWDCDNALIRNPNLINGGPGQSNVGVTGTGVIPNGSEVTIRVTAMDTSLWNADYVIGKQGNPPIGRYLALDVRNGKIFVGDCGNQANIASNKLVHVFNAADGSNISTFAYGSLIGQTNSTEPYDIFGEQDGSYFVVSRYEPLGGTGVGRVYHFDATGTLIANAVTGAGFIRSGDKIGSGVSSIFYLPVNGNGVIRRVPYGGTVANAASNVAIPALLNPSGIAAVDNGANVAPVLYVGCENTNVGVIRLDWNGSGYQVNQTFVKNFWTDQNVFTWTMLNVSGNAANLTVAGTIGTVTSTASNGPWGNAFYSIALANKGDVNSDIFVRTTGAVWRLHPDGTSAWPGRVLPVPATNGNGADLAWDGQYLYFTTGTTGTSYTGRWIIRDAFPDQGEVAISSPIVVYHPVSLSHLSIE